MRAVRLQLIALLAVVAMLFSGAAAARTQYLCRITGIVLADCCCAVADAAPSTPRHRQSARSDCCERVVTAARSAATGTRNALQGVPSAALAAVVPWFIAPDASAELVAVQVRAARVTAGVGPPLFVAHCALLI